jgi:hypothetical protein
MPIEGANVPSTNDVRPTPGMTPFEHATISVERLKAWLTAGSIIASVAAALLAYSASQSTQRRQAAASFQLKAAEIVMASTTPWEAQGKARALAAFFPNDVPAVMAADTFDPAKYGWGRESHRELLTLLLTAPPSTGEHRALVFTMWKAFFPGDSSWVDRIDPRAVVGRAATLR